MLILFRISLSFFVALGCRRDVFLVGVSLHSILKSLTVDSIIHTYLKDLDKEMVESYGWDYLYWDSFFQDDVSSERKLYISSRNRHYNHRGHEIWAEDFGNYLSSNYGLEG